MLVSQLFPAFCDLMECSPPGSSVHGISQARILEWIAIAFSREEIEPGSPALQAVFPIWAILYLLLNKGLRISFGTGHCELHSWFPSHFCVPSVGTGGGACRGGGCFNGEAFGCLCRHSANIYCVHTVCQGLEIWQWTNEAGSWLSGSSHTVGANWKRVNNAVSKQGTFRGWGGHMGLKQGNAMERG